MADPPSAEMPSASATAAESGLTGIAGFPTPVQLVAPPRMAGEMPVKHSSLRKVVLVQLLFQEAASCMASIQDSESQPPEV